MTKPDPLTRPDAPPDTCLSAADMCALSKQREARWRPGLSDQPLHSEIFASGRDASGAGLALALARDALCVSGAFESECEGAVEAALAEAQDLRQLLWVQDKRAVELGGRPYLHGLPQEWRERVICVEASTAQDALFALEEGLKCRDFACVIGEITGNPRALDFTASRRLSLTAQSHGIALWLVRLEARADLSSARMRWRAAPAVSARPRWNGQSPGAPVWQTELFRARSHAPGEWELSCGDRSQTNGSQKAGRLCVAAKPKQTARTSIRTHKRPLEHTPNVPLKPSASPPYRTPHGAPHGPPYGTPHSGNMVRATFGRSLAAVSRG